jgi:hypothetical protein
MPGTIFYMGIQDTTLCFSADQFVMDYELTALASAIKKGFYLYNTSFIPLPANQIVPT